jgi:hypothetical protein
MIPKNIEMPNMSITGKTTLEFTQDFNHCTIDF